MLACARIGAIHSVVFGGFAAHSLALRIDDAEPVTGLRRRRHAAAAGDPVPKPLVDAGFEPPRRRRRWSWSRPGPGHGARRGRDIDYAPLRERHLGSGSRWRGLEQ